MSEPTVLGLLKEQIDGVEAEVGGLRKDFDAHRKETEQGFKDVLARLPANSAEGEIRLNPVHLSRSVKPWMTFLFELGRVLLYGGVGAAAMSDGAPSAEAAQEAQEAEP